MILERKVKNFASESLSEPIFISEPWSNFYFPEKLPAELDEMECSECKGDCFVDCAACGGDGDIECPVCGGMGQKGAQVQGSDYNLRNGLHAGSFNLSLPG